MIDGLDDNGFTVRTTSVEEFDDGQGRRKFKRNIGIETRQTMRSGIAEHVDDLMVAFWGRPRGLTDEPRCRRPCVRGPARPVVLVYDRKPLAEVV